MSKKLAIKGPKTRGKEVIEILEMLGGSNIYNFSACTDYVYYVNDGYQNIIRGSGCICDNEDIQCFTLEEFLEKYPFKVGDKVVYTKFGDNCDDYPVTIESMNWTGTTIEYTFNDCVTCLAKDLKMWNGESDAVISGIYLNRYDYADEVELNLGDYEIEVRDGKTYAVLKKPKYPKTYVECCDVLGISNTVFTIRGLSGKEYDLFDSFIILMRCRDAYWKIAGEEMGLGKPWEPDWNDIQQPKFGIHTVENQIMCITLYVLKNLILIFPTEEMRDAFYENFKDLIEYCKELL